MPRNDQVIRQWHLLRKLESSRGATLKDLGDSLPDDFPKNPRTIRRDLEALGSAGFPLVTEHSNGQTRWKLMEGFRDIPALGFSATELMALLFSRNLLKPLEGTEIQVSLASALNKAATALPPQGHEYVRAMEKVFSVGLGPHKSYQQHKKTIDLITQAIDKARTAQIRYYSASRNMTTRREVDPYRLWYAAGGLYLIAYCHLRKDVRMFAVERIRSISLTDHPYQLPLGFDIEAYVQDALMVMRGRRIEVELVFTKAAAAWVKDKVWHQSQETAQLKDGRLKMILRVADTEELAGWVLSFGSQVRVVRPDGLRQKVKAEARKIFRS
ncbi:MAG: WYL domain-containing protein [Deltaproteobacteria bacterium]|nr:WYL domain-containing protein [Deltaproteobacteria bacterium]